MLVGEWPGGVAVAGSCVDTGRAGEAVFTVRGPRGPLRPALRMDWTGTVESGRKTFSGTGAEICKFGRVATLRLARRPMVCRKPAALIGGVPRAGEPDNPFGDGTGGVARALLPPEDPPDGMVPSGLCCPGPYTPGYGRLAGSIRFAGVEVLWAISTARVASGRVGNVMTLAAVEASRGWPWVCIAGPRNEGTDRKLGGETCPLGDSGDDRMGSGASRRQLDSSTE